MREHDVQNGEKPDWSKKASLRVINLERIKNGKSGTIREKWIDKRLQNVMRTPTQSIIEDSECF